VARSQEQPGQLYIRIDADDERLVAAWDDSGAPAPGDTVRIDAGHSPDALRPTVVVAQPDLPRLVAREGGWSGLVVTRAIPRCCASRSRTSTTRLAQARGGG
jgi:hypothetical protein